MSRLLVMPRRDRSRSSLEASPLRLEGARLLLVTGTAGSGKRIIGNLLVDEHDYVHIDLDNPHANRRFLGNGIEGLRAELEANLEPGQDTVVSWTPEPQRRAAVRARDARLRLRLGLARRRSRCGVPQLLQRPRRRGGAVRRPVRARRQLPPGRGRARRGARARPRRPAGAGAPAGEACRRSPRCGRPAAVRARVWRAQQPSRWPASPPPRTCSSAASAGTASPAAQAKPATIPATGILVSGESLGGVRLGDTRTDVRNALGPQVHRLRGLRADDVVLLVPVGRVRARRRVPPGPGHRRLHARSHGRLAQHGRAQDRRLHEQQGAAGEERVEELPRLQRQARDDAATP